MLQLMLIWWLVQSSCGKRTGGEKVSQRATLPFCGYEVVRRMCSVTEQLLLWTLCCCTRKTQPSTIFAPSAVFSSHLCILSQWSPEVASIPLLLYRDVVVRAVLQGMGWGEIERVQIGRGREGWQLCRQ